MNIKRINFSSELSFKTSRSGGAGGQHVNKVASKVELDFDVIHSKLLTDIQKTIILKGLKSKITKEGILQIIVQEERSQLANKEIAREKFYELISQCLVRRKKRRPTKPSQGSKERRLKSKKIHSEIKKSRKGDF